MDFGISAHVVGPLGLGAYWRGQDYFIGFSYALAATFATWALSRSILFRQGRTVAAGAAAGGMTLVGALMAGGCFLIGSNFFIQAHIPPHVRHHATAPAIINGSGRQNPFTHDGI